MESNDQSPRTDSPTIKCEGGHRKSLDVKKSGRVLSDNVDQLQILYRAVTAYGHIIKRRFHGVYAEGR